MCIVMDNLIDNKLICNRTDAFRHIIYELSKRAPELVKFDEMIYIKASEFTQLKNELAFIKNVQSKQKVVMEKVNNLVGEDALTMSDIDLGFAIDHIKNILKLWDARVG